MLDAAGLVDYVKANNVEFIDVRFCDLTGTMHHMTVPADPAGTEELSAGVAFDGSSVRGFQSIAESDMTLLPDFTTARIDPFRQHVTLGINFFVHDPITLKPYSRDPRNVARKAEQYLASSNIADLAYFGTEAEFYVFDDVRYDSGAHFASYRLDAESAAWNTAREEAGGNLGYKLRTKGGYSPLPPLDHYAELRDDISAHLRDSGFTVERAHHEVGSGGQNEINYRYNTLLAAADDLMLFKHIVKNTAWAHGKSATFMPKPLFGDNGSGMHCHQSLWRGGKPLFYDESGYGQLSDLARHYIGGILAHAPSLLAFTNPTVNSYRRLVPGFEAPVNLVYSARNRSACIRIPLSGASPAAKRIEFRCPDPSANPYLALAAQLMAGIDGIRNSTEPPEPIDKDLYELGPEEARGGAQTPGSLPQVLDALERDHDYLLAGDVFTLDQIAEWVNLKRRNEVAEVQQRPHPHEFALYYDV